MNNLPNTFPGGYMYVSPLGQWLDVSPEQLWMVHDGDQAVAEWGYSNSLLRRYVYGPGMDEPIVWYEGSGTGDKRYLDQDERGSVTRITRQDGSTLAINSYDEYGIPASTNQGRFQYTGQAWIPALGMYYYKARTYSPTLGRFMQTDPIGYRDGLNWYNYVGGDPINGTDPSGTTAVFPDQITVTGNPCSWGNGCQSITGWQNIRDFYDNWNQVNQPTDSCVDQPDQPQCTVTITANRKKSSPQKKVPQCEPGPGWQKGLETGLGWAAEVADDVATVAAYTGQEEIAGPAEAASWVFNGLKIGSQLYRGDQKGASATFASAASSTLVGKFNKILPIGDGKISGRVASTLGRLTGPAVDTFLSCE